MHARCHFKQSNLCHDNSHAGQKISMIVSDPVDIGTRTNCRVGRGNVRLISRSGKALLFFLAVRSNRSSVHLFHFGFFVPFVLVRRFSRSSSSSSIVCLRIPLPSFESAVGASVLEGAKWLSRVFLSSPPLTTPPHGGLTAFNFQQTVFRHYKYFISYFTRGWTV